MIVFHLLILMIGFGWFLDGIEIVRTQRYLVVINNNPLRQADKKVYIGEKVIPAGIIIFFQGLLVIFIVLENIPNQGQAVSPYVPMIVIIIITRLMADTIATRGEIEYPQKRK